MLITCMCLPACQIVHSGMVSANVSRLCSCVVRLVFTEARGLAGVAWRKQPCVLNVWWKLLILPAWHVMGNSVLHTLVACRCDKTSPDFLLHACLTKFQTSFSNSVLWVGKGDFLCSRNCSVNTPSVIASPSAHVHAGSYVSFLHKHAWQSSTAVTFSFSKLWATVH